MASYNVVEIDGEYKIKELATEQYVMKYENIVDAKKHCKKLNLGSIGFDGFTPKFIAEYYN